MRTGNRALAFLAVLIGVPAARTGAADLGTVLNHLLEQLPGLGHQPAATPQVVPPAGPDGPSVSLGEGALDDPVRLEQRLRRLLRAAPSDLRLTVPDGQARLGDFSIGSNETFAGNLLVLCGDLDVFGKVSGNVVTLDGDIVLHAGAQVAGDALAIGGRIRDRGGVVLGERRALGASPVAPAVRTGWLASALINAAGVIGVLVTLTLIGFGTVLFAQPQLEIVSDTVSHNLLRAFVTGLLAQILAIPTFGMLITGLVLSVVGILLVPFVVIVIPLLVVTLIVGGFLAVAHAIGESHVRRRMAAGVVVGSANSYRYLLIGLSGLAAVWLAWIVFGWVPVAGTLMFSAALLATWFLTTIGFGACLLSRAGIKPTFAGRYVPPEALTDEYLWATPQFGVTAAKRPQGKLPREGR